MSILDTVRSSRDNYAGIRVAIAGVEKSGKTTLVCGAPGALLVPLEAGYAGVDVQHIPMVKTYQEFVTLLGEVTSGCAARQFPFKSLVIDSVTALERLIHESVLLTDPLYNGGANKNVTMESALGGYGKAYQVANERFMVVISMLDTLALQYGINIVFTCHVFANIVIDPQVGEYSSWDLLLHSPKNFKTYGKREFFTQWADGIFFLHEPLMIVEQNNMKRGISENKGRVLGLSRTPSYVAGNRFGCEGEISIPKQDGWNYLAHALHTSCGIDVFRR